MSEKRFDIVGKEFVGYTEGYAYIIRDNSIICEPHRWRQWSVLEDKEDVEDLCDLLNFQNTQIKILKEENEQLRKQINDKDDVRKPLCTQIPTTTTITSKRRVVPLNMRHRWY